MGETNTISAIKNGETALGIELGSTRIKSVLINKDYEVVATGFFNWENRYENELWTYHLNDAVKGLQCSFQSLVEDVYKRYGIELSTVGCIGISGMMHGIIALDENNNQLSPFLTWRNTNTSQAVEELTDLFNFNIPLRWTIAQLYQSILNKESHVKDINYVSTLSGYIHLLLSGKRVIGIGEASGMFPIDSEMLDFDQEMVNKFDSVLSEKRMNYSLRDIFPKVIVAGKLAGKLTEEGAKILDGRGILKPGIPMVAPEGDAGTGMVATNSVAPRTGNVSAGTSIFSMVVLEKRLSRLYKDIDMVTTPDGRPVAMVHCNNGTSELDQWFSIFKEFAESLGCKANTSQIYDAMYYASLDGSPSCDEVILFNYLSGEPITGLMEGHPLLVRKSNGRFNFANFMRSQIYSIFAALSIGTEILIEENVSIDKLTGHGGMFKTKGVAQRYLSAAMNAPVTVMENAGEGGPFGMALLAAFYLWGKENQGLEDFLETEVFSKTVRSTIMATKDDIVGFKQYMERYLALINVEKAAVESFKLKEKRCVERRIIV